NDGSCGFLGAGFGCRASLRQATAWPEIPGFHVDPGNPAGGVSFAERANDRPAAFATRGLDMGGGSEAEAGGGFFADLKRRRVIRVLLLYAVAGWIVIEVASVVLPALNL